MKPNILNLEPQKSLCDCFDGVSLRGLTWFWSSFPSIFSNVQNLKSDFQLNQRGCVTSTDRCELLTCLGLVSDLAVSCFILVNTLMCPVSFPLPLFVFFFPPPFFTCYFLPASEFSTPSAADTFLNHQFIFFFLFLINHLSSINISKVLRLTRQKLTISLLDPEEHYEGADEKHSSDHAGGDHVHLLLQREKKKKNKHVAYISPSSSHTARTIRSILSHSSIFNS